MTEPELDPVAWVEAQRVLACAPDGPVVVVADTARALDRLVERSADLVRRTGRTVAVRRVEPVADVARAVALAGAFDGAGAVLGIGGGSVLDLVKIATLAARPDVVRRLLAPQRAGMVMLPLSVRRSVPLVAVPTTLGTGAESSAVATCLTGDVKRLVFGPGLRPDAAVLDPAATEGLPAGLRGSGALEILLRLAGPYVADDAGTPTADAVVEAVARILPVHAERVVAGVDDAAERRELALIGALSHSPLLLRAADPFGVRSWYVANELSSVLAVPKMAALAAVAPVVWRLVLDGDERWGSADRLRRLWACIDPEHRHDASAGLARLAADWGVAVVARPRDLDVADLGRRVLRAWGHGLPMLGAFDADEITALLDDALGPPGQVVPVASRTAADPAA